MDSTRRAKPVEVTTKVSAIQCPKCKQWVYSRARHDFNSCSCGAVAIDGGFDYTKLSYDPDIKFEDIKFESFDIKASKADLYNDWNHNKNVYGRFFVITAS